MKLKDIFEREFDGNVLRFQLTELDQHTVCIELMSDCLQFGKDICCHIGPPYPTFVFASLEHGDFVTTTEGDNKIEMLTQGIYKRIKSWRSSVQWVYSNTSLKDAEDLVNKISEMVWCRGDDRYLQTVVRWVCYGEIDLDNKTDIKRMEELISSFHNYCVIRTKAKNVKVDYKVNFVNDSFKRVNKDGTEIQLEKMEELEDAIRYCLNSFIMKKNDIFELDFKGQIIRFRLLELKPYLITVQTMDITPPIIRSGNIPLTALPKAALAKNVDGEFVTTIHGIIIAYRFTDNIYKKIAAQR